MKSFLLTVVSLLFLYEGIQAQSGGDSPLTPPTVTTTPCSNIGYDNAYLTGIVNPNGASTVVSFSYGLTTSYGSTITPYNSPVNGTLNVSLGDTASNLIPLTTYHYRCVATNSSGTTYGADMTFTTLDTLAYVITTAATNITGTGAQLNGWVNPLNMPTTMSFNWGLTTSYGNTIAANPPNVNSNYSVNEMATLTGLTPGTTYHYRLVGVNSAGTSYGLDFTFTTTFPLVPPAVITTAATNITPFNANLNGTVNANNYSSTVSFEYGSTTSYGNTIAGSPSVVTGNTVTPSTALINNLNAGATYHYRCKATSSAGTTYGADMTFTTPNSAPSILSRAATAIGNTTAQLNAMVRANSQTSTVTFEWGLTPSYGNTVSATPSTVTGIIYFPVLANLTGLIINTTYHFRCVAVNATGTTYGNDSTFTTTSPPAAPTVTTTAATNVKHSSAKMNGIVDANYGTSTVSFQYGTTSSYGSTVSGIPSSVSGNTNTNVVGYLFGLLPLTTYHFRCVATNSQGTTYGNDLTFTTIDTLAHVVTYNATGVTANSSQLNGNVDPENLPATVSFQWGTTTSYGNTVNATPSSVNGTLWVPVLANLTGLTAGTTYHFRCLAVNSAGTSYGMDKTFTTSVILVPPTMTTGPAVNLTSNIEDLTGTANANGFTTTCTFEYGLTSAYGSTANASPHFVNGSSVQNIHGWATGLSPHTLYHYRSVGINSGGTSYGADMTFISNDTTPYVNTNPATSIGVTEAVLNGMVKANSDSASVIFEWGLTTSYGNTVTASPGYVYGNSYMPVTASISGLLNNTTYHFRCKADNSAGTGYGADYVFTTGCTPPGSAGIIQGADTVCTGSTNVSYSCDLVAGAISYVWSVPSGAVILSGAGTISISVDFGTNATSGIISVYASDLCGNGPVSNLAVEVLPAPLTPVIILNGPILFSNISSGNQWYMNGVAIQGATSQEWDAALSGSGWYWDVVSVAGVQSDTSNHIYVLVTGTREPQKESISLYPVPVDDKITFSFPETYKSVSIEIYDLSGKKVYDSGLFIVEGKKVIDLKELTTGVYFAMIKSGAEKIVKKIIII